MLKNMLRYAFMLFTLPPSLDMDKTISQLTHIKAVLLFASTMTVRSGATIAPALRSISRHFPDQPQVVIQLILTLPALMITLFSSLMGYLADRFGRKKLLLMMLDAPRPSPQAPSSDLNQQINQQTTTSHTFITAPSAATFKILKLRP